MDDRAPLTERQKEILDFFAAYERSRGLAPTHRDICERFGFSSYGTVHKHLRILREKGYLAGEAHQKRALRLVGTPPGPPHVAAELTSQAGREPATELVDLAPLVDLPFLGRIAAGHPIEAWPGHERLAVPPHLLHGPLGEHYVLRVVGDSMIDEGVHDGDLVVVQRREQAAAGEMIVALVGEEATLKRFYPEGAVVRLQPAHPTMQALRVPAGEVRVQGVVVGLMRKF